MPPKPNSIWVTLGSKAGVPGNDFREYLRQRFNWQDIEDRVNGKFFLIPVAEINAMISTIKEHYPSLQDVSDEDIKPALRIRLKHTHDLDNRRKARQRETESDYPKGSSSASIPTVKETGSGGSMEITESSTSASIGVDTMQRPSTSIDVDTMQRPSTSIDVDTMQQPSTSIDVDTMQRPSRPWEI